jgi:hypothetical protein
MFRRILAAAAAALALFHVWLFAGQALQGELADPARLARWLFALLLLAALAAFYRAGVPLLRGRKAVAIWLLAALLHGPAIGERLDTLGTPSIPEAVSALAGLGTAAAGALGLLLILWLARAPRAAALRLPLTVVIRAAAGPLAPGAHVPFAPRPPPLR